MRRILAFTLALMLAFMCSACGNGSDQQSEPTKTDYPVTAFDATVKSCPQKIISLSPTVTEIITELGSDAQLVGVSDHCQTKRELVRLGTTFSPKLDVIIKLKADVVFTDRAVSSADKAEIEKSGAVVIRVGAINSYADLADTYVQIASVTSGNITGAKNASNTFDQLDSKLKALANSEQSKNKVVVFLTESVLVPRGTFADELFAFAGVENIAKAESMTDEEIEEAKPYVILCDDDIYDKITERFSDIKVVTFDPLLLDSRASGMINAVEALKAAIKIEPEVPKNET